MKSIISIIFFTSMFLCSYSQIKMSGTKEVTKNTEHEGVDFVRKEIDVTRTVQENPKNRIVVKNKIENSTVSNVDGGVKIAISPSTHSSENDNVPKQIIIDMKEAKESNDLVTKVNGVPTKPSIKLESPKVVVTPGTAVPEKSSFNVNTGNSSNPVVIKTVPPSTNSGPKELLTTTVVEEKPTTPPVEVKKNETNTTTSAPSLNINNSTNKPNINESSETTTKPTSELPKTSNLNVSGTNPANTEIKSPEAPKEIVKTELVLSEEKKAEPVKTELVLTEVKEPKEVKAEEVKTVVKTPSPTEEVKEKSISTPSIVEPKPNSTSTEALVSNPKTNLAETTNSNVSKPTSNNVVKITSPTKTETPLQEEKLEEPKAPTMLEEENNTTVEGNSYTTEENANDYPEKKANHWALGFNAGIPFITGDVRSKVGYGGSITIQKALGHVVSLRFQSLYAEVFGQDWKLQAGENAYKNYKSRISDHTLQAVFTLNNINFYKRQPKAIFNIIAGAGFSTNYSWTNLLDENGNFYDYSSVPAAADRSDKGDILDAINNLQDKGYETNVVQNKLDAHIKNTDINPTVVLGIGLGFRISKRVDLNLEHRVSWHNADNLDAYTANGNSDWMQYSSLGVNFKIGKKEDAMWFMNPVFAAYDDIKDLKKKVDEGELLTDTDKDGVADIFDKDSNTPESVLVDSRGVASDLDKDGVPDYLDKEPFTPIGASVDKDGKAIDSDEDGVPDVYDMEENTPKGAQVDNKGRAIKAAAGSGFSYTGANGTSVPLIGAQELGFILFDDNSAVINKIYYPELYKVLSLTKSDPNVMVVITGHTDVRDTDSYNMDLSKARANAVYTMLTEVFKVPSSRLEIRFEGERNPLVPGLPEYNSAQYAAGHQMNRRVTLSIK
ncbi:MAG: OmpA family protein [Chitinophagales bacterium]